MQRSRKCSIVQEDEEEEDISSCSGREDLGPPLNRRGSRSEGRLNLALQERLAESDRRKLTTENEKVDAIKHTKEKPSVNTQKCPMGKSNSMIESPLQNKLIKDMSTKGIATTTIITDSSTISIPIITSNTGSTQSNLVPKYKTMPSPTRPTFSTPGSNAQLNEIFEEDCNENSRVSSRQFVSRNQNRTPYEQRRSKFHKSRTASCSSSDASDDDSEKRKKRAHKLNTSSKPFQGRRDSHDDSSDSQEPGTGCGTGGTNSTIKSNTLTVQSNTHHTSQDNNKNGGNNGNTGGRKNSSNTSAMFGRRHKGSRRRNGETRLRESQSLNRITEVQEDGAHSLVISTAAVGVQGNVTPRVKGIGAKLLQGINLSVKKPNEDKCSKSEDKSSHVSRRDTIRTVALQSIDFDKISKDPKTNYQSVLSDKSNIKKIRILGKYFQVHKKLCIPIPGIFNRNRLYKTQSCSSLSADKIAMNSETLRCRQRAVSVVRNSIGSEGDINQNHNDHRRKSTVVQLNNVCNELTGICATHLGQASKCCSFC